MRRVVFACVVVLKLGWLTLCFAQGPVQSVRMDRHGWPSEDLNPVSSLDQRTRAIRTTTSQVEGREVLVARDQVIVRFATDRSDRSGSADFKGNQPWERTPEILEALQMLGVEISKTWCDGLLNLVTLGPEADLSATLDSLRELPQVLYAVPDYWITPAEFVPNDPGFTVQWGMRNTEDIDIDATLAWEQTTGDSTTLVAVMDSGVDYTHPDMYLAIALNEAEIPADLLAQLVDTNSDGVIDFYDLNSLDSNGEVILDGGGDKYNASLTTDLNGNGYIDAGDLMAAPWNDGADDDGNGMIDDLTGWDVVNDTNDPMDWWGHGTHIAGIIAARGNNGLGTAGVNWSARVLPQRFISQSGGLTSDAIQAVENSVSMGADVINSSWGLYVDDPALEDAIDWAGDNGAVLVAAAGNDSNDNDGADPYYPASYDLPNLISVASVDPTGELSDFSSYGASTVDIAAPGRNIYSLALESQYAYWTGTSMATPHVAGVVSLLAGRFPSLSPDALVERALATSKPLSDLSGKTTTGGMVSALVAVNIPQVTGPRIIAASPMTELVIPPDRLVVTFDQAIDSQTFTSADVIIGGPNGPIFATEVNQLTDLVFEVLFPNQAELGFYDVLIGPEVEDTLGRLMDQDADGITGEPIDDPFRMTFRLVPPPETWVIDNGDAGYVASGGWTTYDGSGAEGDFDYIDEGNGSETAIWSFGGLMPGTYRVSATWERWDNRVVDAPYTVLDGSTELATVLIDQQQYPADLLEDGVMWETLGSPYELAGDTLVVRLNNLGTPEDSILVADAVRVERLSTAGEVLFRDGLESGDLSEWTASTEREQD